jgi:hypothetical protein
MHHDIPRTVWWVFCVMLVSGCGHESLAQASSRPFASGPCPEGKQIAFRGAEGFGQCAQGGRGGRVIEVTNLNDSGPGSFRQCAEVESGPRTCVFRVGGRIPVTTWPTTGKVNSPMIDIVNPYLTIAGQTAPGDGVSIDGFIWIRTDHVVVRHIRCRPGWAIENNWSFGIGGSDIILDHVSAAWSTDETITITGWRNITIQWSIVAEGIYDTTNQEHRQSKGIFLWGAEENITLHHNYLAMNGSRNPAIYLKPLEDSPQPVIDIVNNVVYYYDQGGSAEIPAYDGPSYTNWVSNLYVQHQGARWTGWAPLRVMGNTAYAKQTGLYLRGNISQERPSNDLDEKKFVWNDGPETSQYVTTRYPAPKLASETDAFTAYAQVLAEAGATVPVRDAVDARIISYIRSATVKPGLVTKGTAGKIIKHENDVGGYPTYKSGIRPVDTDHDGIPDAWERSRNLNPADPSDGQADNDGDGYTNFEDYLHDPMIHPDMDHRVPPRTSSLFSFESGSAPLPSR